MLKCHYNDHFIVNNIYINKLYIREKNDNF